VKAPVLRLPLIGPFLRAVRRAIPRRAIRGRGNRVVIRGVQENVRFDIEGDDNVVIAGARTRIANTLVFIRGNGHRIEIGDECSIGGGELWLEDSGGSIVIGRATTIEKAHIAVTEGRTIAIGSDCMLARDVEIRVGDSHSILDESGRRINPAADVTIEDHVWLAGRVVVLKGVTVATGAIVGSSSVVTSDVAARTIVAGTPARPLRGGVTWDRRRL
jgi:acetyltransferase-like isoleucine patch superfamily enzyme